MKAAYYTGNKTFAIESVQPVAPGEGEVQVSVAYCGICGTDLHVFNGAMDARVGSHRVIGHEMSGKITVIGEKVQDLNIGDPVVIRPLAACGSCPACQRGHTHICQNLKFLGLDVKNFILPRRHEGHKDFIILFLLVLRSLRGSAIDLFGAPSPADLG